MSLLLLPKRPVEPGIIGVWQGHNDVSGDLTVAIPAGAGIAAGDILVAVGGANNQSAITNLTGWSAWDQQLGVTGAQAVLATKTAAGTENGTNIVFDTLTNGRNTLIIVAIRASGAGILTVDLHPAAATDAVGGTSTVASPTGTSAQANELVLDLFVGRVVSGTGSFTQPTNYTLVQESGTLAASVNLHAAIARKAQASAGAVSALQLTNAASMSGSVGWTLTFYEASANQSKNATDTATGTDFTAAKKIVSSIESGTGTDVSTEVVKFTGAGARTDSGAGFEQGARAYGQIIGSGQATGASTTIASGTLSVTPAVGELVVAWFSQQATGKALTVADNSVGGNTWNLIQLQDATVGMSSVLAWTIVVNTFTTVTATSPVSAGGRMAGVMRYPAGTFASSPQDIAVLDSDDTGSTSNVASTGTLSQAPDQVIALTAMFSQRADPSTDYIFYDSAWIPRDVRGHTTTTTAWHALAEQTVFSTGSQSVTASFLATDRSHIALLALKFPSSTTIKNTTDTGTGADVSTLKAVLPRTDASASSTDVSTLKAVHARTESGTGADISTLKVSLPRTDSATGTETTRSYRNRTESGTGADASTEKVALPRVDTSTCTDASKSLRNRTDTASGSDASVEKISLPRTDAATGTESTRSFRNRNDSGTGADVSTERVVYARTETAIGVDNTQSYRSRADTGFGTDASIEKVALPRTDAASGTETTRHYYRATDAGTATDASTIKVPVTGTDTGTCSDISRSFRNRTESGNSSEVSALHASLNRTETGTCLDNSRNARSRTDTATGTEASTLHALIARTEQGVGAELSTEAEHVVALDSATGVEASTLHVSLPRTDTGSATNGSFLHARYSLIESASGAEATQHYYKASDTGSCTDISHVGVPKSGTDSATSADSSTLTAKFSLVEVSTGTDSSIEHAAFQVLESGTETDHATVNTFVQIRPNDSATATDSATEHAALSPTDTVVTNDSSLEHVIHSRSENGATSESSSLHAAPTGVDAGIASEATQSRRAGTESASGTDTSTERAIYSRVDLGASADLSALHVLLARADAAVSADSSHVTQGKVPVSGTDTGASFDQSTFHAALLRDETAQAIDRITQRRLAVIDLGRGFDRSTGGEPPVTTSKMVIDLRTGNVGVWLSGKTTKTSTYLDTHTGRLIMPGQHSLSELIDA